MAAAIGDGFSGPVGGRQVPRSPRRAGWSVGAAVAYLVRLLSRPLGGDPLIANAISLATPFGAYLLAEEVHVSGVLAVVVAGLIIGHHAPRSASGASRLQTSAVWRLVDFLLEGFVFLLIGQQLPAVVRGLAQYERGARSWPRSAISVGVVLLLRPLWLLLTQSLPRSLHTRLGGDPTGTIPPPRAGVAGSPIACPAGRSRS